MRYAMIAACSVLSLAAALAAVVVAGPAPLLLAAGMSLVIGFGWPAATGIAARHRHNVIMSAAGVVAALLVQTLPGQQLVWLPAVVGVALVTVFAAELVRGEGAEHRLESTIASTAGVLATVSSSGWIALASDYRATGPDPVQLVVVGAVVAALVAVVGARVISSAPKRSPKRGVVALGVTPVAFLGVGALFTARLVSTVVA
ncbi:MULTISPECIES: hypothetical protein [Kocuria]|uniref:hypothetical protein n=1 Tax=Kocuria TaxID=57493 RepID=UPI0006497E0A|nr:MULTISPECIES: hypothetical protein [Kocuria]KLU09516.1 hypothetical protein ABL57_11820 [Kocuria sp. SM24M-10]OLT09289.1 hypothetical protein BJF77_10845 [Kocuria sp. CNJ-770]